VFWRVACDAGNRKYAIQYPIPDALEMHMK